MHTIIGAGLSGISASFHLGHENCVVFEKNKYTGGHIHSYYKNGFLWDEGPHVSFTKNEYVKGLFAKSVNDEFLEYPVFPSNYFQGNWIPHPAQSNLYAVPEPFRTECLNSFLSSRAQNKDLKPANYHEWLESAFGSVFNKCFSTPYTKKYWTIPPEMLSTSWVGERVFYPDIETVKKGYHKPLENSTHYISNVRYPKTGGYNQYTSLMDRGINVYFEKEIIKIDIRKKCIYFKDGTHHHYESLINTMPLPEFIKKVNAPQAVVEAAQLLKCSQLLLINIEVNHPCPIHNQWLYVYDEDKYSTRINFTELLSPHNAPSGKSGIQVEVYFSDYKPIKNSIEFIVEKVLLELVELKLIQTKNSIIDFHTIWVPWANVIYDQYVVKSLGVIFEWLANFGLTREIDDLEPITNWLNKFAEPLYLGKLILAGRFGQWKYYWSDDCVLRGKIIGEML